MVTTYWVPNCEHGGGITPMTYPADAAPPAMQCFCGVDFVQTDAP
jgi:hypothetical protein